MTSSIYQHFGHVDLTPHGHQSTIVVCVYELPEDYPSPLAEQSSLNTSRVHANEIHFRFSTSKITTGNKDELGETTQILRYQIYEKLRKWNGLNEKQKSRAQRPSIIWTTKGLGTWLVKKALVEDVFLFKTTTLVDITLDTISIDYPELVEGLTTISKYKKILRNVTQQKFWRPHLHKSKRVNSKLAEDLLAIDHAYLLLLQMRKKTVIGWEKPKLPESLSERGSKKREGKVFHTLNMYHRAVLGHQRSEPRTDHIPTVQPLDWLRPRDPVRIYVAACEDLIPSRFIKLGGLRGALIQEGVTRNISADNLNHEHSERPEIFTNLILYFKAMSVFQPYCGNNGEESSTDQYGHTHVSISNDEEFISFLKLKIKTFSQDQDLESGVLSVKGRPHSRPGIGYCRLHLAQAVLLAIGGDYGEALVEIEHAGNAYKLLLEPGDTERLEASSLRAFLLTAYAKPLEAEPLCRTTITMMTAKVKGLERLTTLATMSNMIDILMQLWYFGSAVEYANFLSKTTEGTLGHRHPLTLHCKSQLALSQYYCGDYSSAETNLESIFTVFGNSPVGSYPDRFEYYSFLARVYLAKGMMKLAEKYINMALVGGMAESSTETTVINSTNFDNFGLTISNAPNKYPKRFVRVHTERQKRRNLRLLSLQKIHAEVLFQSCKESRAITILTEAWNEEQRLLGEKHLSTIASLYRLAIMARESYKDLEMYQTAKNQLQTVLEVRQNTLGESNAATLSAQREVFKINHHIKLVGESDIQNSTDPSDDKNWLGTVSSMSEYIYATHTSHLGKYHPESLESLLWLFNLRLCNPTKEITFGNPEVKALLSALRSPYVRKNRLKESLSMELYVALLYCSCGYFHTAERILDQLSRAIKDSLDDGNQGMHSVIKNLDANAEKLKGFCIEQNREEGVLQSSIKPAEPAANEVLVRT
ncbi:hypothetical protein F4805DRAFT_441903 [Annulohypoxylon moriforme]|nr:hypothetical protein F4805DRAFT_441903 [Annulohypoxylon moriforme]